MMCNYVSPIHLNYLNVIVYLYPTLCIVADIFHLHRYCYYFVLLLLLFY